jgi:hypothetical protein
MKKQIIPLLCSALIMAADPLFVGESDRRIPVNYKVDVVVVGGSTGAVAAAVASAGSGAKVLVVAPRPYLGEDLCATMRLWLEKGETPTLPLARQLFTSRGPLRPMQVKKTLDDALLTAGVEFLYSSYATDVLRDESGRMAGIVMANRAGRQAVLAKMIIDATPRGSVARFAGAQFRPYPAGPRWFHRVSIGGNAKPRENVTVRKTGLAYRGDGTVAAEARETEPAVEIVEYAIRIPVEDASFPSFARAEQIARDLTYSESEKANTEELFAVPPDAIHGAKSVSGSWKGVAQLHLGAFRPAAIGGLYLVSGAGDIPRSQAERLVRPLALMELGERIGKQAAEEALKAPAPRSAAARGSRRAPVVGGDVRESLAGVRPAARGLETIPSLGQVLPVLGSYDVVIAGGGTAGAPAAISAARAKAKTLVVEYLHGMGGVGTLGMISRYWWGNRIGFSREVPGILERHRLVNAPFSWNPLQKAEWLRRTAREAGAEVWFGAVVCGAYVDGRRVRGIVVATPEGRGVVLAKVVIDSTGNADVAAPAGAQTVVTGASEIAQQGVGLPRINLGSGYTNSDFTLTDDTDLVDIWHLLVYVKEKYSGEFDVGQLVDSRERRRIVGEFELSLSDQLTGRTFPDTIALGFSDLDTHGYTIDPLLLLSYPGKTDGIEAKLPYRCLLPKGLDAILVTGIGVSVHRDALPAVRMQPDVENQGYAAGLAAAMASRGDGVRSINVRELQQQLIAKGVLPLTVLKETDSFPLPAAEVAKAVADPRTLRSTAVLVSHPEVSSALLRKAYQEAQAAEDRLTYATILAVLGDATGLDTLIADFEAKGGSTGRDWADTTQPPSVRMKSLDNAVVAMARTRDRRALAPILKRAAILDSNTAFGHHRAVAVALEMLGDGSAADVLAAVLSKPGMIGYTVTNVQRAKELSGSSPDERMARLLSLREIGLARVLYKLGDKDGIAKRVLAQYTQDLRGHFSRHAQAVLEERR